MKNYPWKSRALCIEAPTPNEVDRFCDFIKTRLAADKIDLLVLLTRYRFEFDSHPECRGREPLSKADAGRIADACKAAGIRLVPKMNLLGHQNDADTGAVENILVNHPDFDESKGEENLEYCRSLCPSHPETLPMVLDLVDEMIDAFRADAFHMGMDEVFEIAKCPRCKGKDPADLFANWVNAIAAHLKARGVQPFMWGDRLLDSAKCGHGPWDASQNGTYTAIDKVDKDIVICDWHYHNWPRFPSVEFLADAGFKIYLATFNVAENAKLFLDYAKEHDRGNILGVMETTWVPAKYMMDGLEGKELEDSGELWFKDGTPHVVRCYKWLFEEA